MSVVPLKRFVLAAESVEGEGVPSHRVLTEDIHGEFVRYDPTFEHATALYDILKRIVSASGDKEISRRLTVLVEQAKMIIERVEQMREASDTHQFHQSER